ncbi:hypothetical protein G7Y89_g7443 [Cudoniella acicularis]|uniref:Transposase n=1 Tax=Cudoniella acicularis TaxID=354080 RepID=A0A8H4W4J5_9HELO|nr:hypothetical protein G7Y89_g7443 [Cudoniella acicularis]
MEYDIPSSSPLHGPGDNWNTPRRARVRQMRRDGKSWGNIFKQLGVPRASARSICKDKSSRTTRKGKQYHHLLLSIRAIRQIIRHIARNHGTHRLTFEQVRQQLGLVASARTIRRELRKNGYRRCIACPRPFISRAQGKRRLAFAREHQWWGTSDYAAHRDDGKQGGDWRKVIWSDEATFDTGKDGRVWVTRRVDEKCCPDCIKSIYRSGRSSVMIWGALGWDYKSPLVFMEKLPGRKGICSKAYLQEVLEPVVFPLFETLGPEYIFMEDGSKVHLGFARLPRLEHGVRGFNWPPSSPDLNPIEKVWRWMKGELNKMAYKPRNKAALMEAIQGLWDRVDPLDYRHYVEQLTYKVDDVIKVRGLATIN